jgi:hypothetical protein
MVREPSSWEQGDAGRICGGTARLKRGAFAAGMNEKRRRS